MQKKNRGKNNSFKQTSALIHFVYMLRTKLYTGRFDVIIGIKSQVHKTHSVTPMPAIYKSSPGLDLEKRIVRALDMKFSSLKLEGFGSFRLHYYYNFWALWIFMDK